MNVLPEPMHSRMLAAGEAWLVWAAAHKVSPLDATCHELECAALDLRAHGGTEIDVLDLLDQVGFMTGLWRTAEWTHLRKTIDAFPARGPGPTSDEVSIKGGTLRTHGPAKCAADDFCPIHRPSPHPLATAPMAWRHDVALLERVCPHGVHHPDSDALEYARRTHGTDIGDRLAVHGCDGCCRKET
ncbi:hypothetical protein ASE38_01570 [Cellulomonas sp. Root930]|nr:hypothetical protein ASE38_01570 [Cellulomonas sp. Root930]